MAEQQFMDEADLRALWAKVLEVAVPKPDPSKAGYVLTVNDAGTGYEWKAPQSQSK